MGEIRSGMAEYLTLLPTSEQAARERALVKAWEDGGKVGPHPLSRQARFARGETLPDAWQGAVALPGLPRRRVRG